MRPRTVKLVMSFMQTEHDATAMLLTSSLFLASYMAAKAFVWPDPADATVWSRLAAEARRANNRPADIPAEFFVPANSYAWLHLNANIPSIRSASLLKMEGGNPIIVRGTREVLDSSPGLGYPLLMQTFSWSPFVGDLFRASASAPTSTVIVAQLDLECKRMTCDRAG